MILKYFFRSFIIKFLKIANDDLTLWKICIFFFHLLRYNTLIAFDMILFIWSNFFFMFWHKLSICLYPDAWKEFRSWCFAGQVNTIKMQFGPIQSSNGGWMKEEIQITNDIFQFLDPGWGWQVMDQWIEHQWIQINQLMMLIMIQPEEQISQNSLNS